MVLVLSFPPSPNSNVGFDLNDWFYQNGRLFRNAKNVDKINPNIDIGVAGVTSQATTARRRSFFSQTPDSQIMRRGLSPTTHTPKTKTRRYKHRIPIATFLSVHTWIGTNTAATSGWRLRTKQCRGAFLEEGVSMFENTLSCSKSSCHS